MTVVGFFHLVAFFFFFKIKLGSHQYQAENIVSLVLFTSTITALPKFQCLFTVLTLLLTMNSCFSDLASFFKMQT